MSAKDNTKIHWGVLGVGNVCKVKSAPAMNKIPGSRLAAVMRRDVIKAREYARLHNVPRWYDDADALLADPEINAVYIATPPHVHLELTRKAAAAGKPVYVEKPMARTWRECQEMIDVCEQAGVPLFVAYYRRMLPNYRKIKELVDGGVIGDVRSVSIRMSKPANPATDRDPANWRVNPHLAGGGYFYDLASHQLDFLDYLLGPIADVHGFSSNQAGLYKAEDIVTGTFRFENGVHGTGSWCFTAAESATTDLTIITGSKGEIHYPTFSDYYLDLKTDTPGKTSYAPANQPPDDTVPSSPSTHAVPSASSAPSATSPHSASSAPSPGQSEHIAPGTIRFHFDMPEHIQQPLIETIVSDLMTRLNADDPDSRDARLKKEKTPAGESIGNIPGSTSGFKCPSTGISAARTNRVMEEMLGPV